MVFFVRLPLAYLVTFGQNFVCWNKRKLTQMSVITVNVRFYLKTNDREKQTCGLMVLGELVKS